VTAFYARLRTDGLRDRRVHPVGADDHIRIDPLASSAGKNRDAANASAMIDNDVVGSRTISELRTAPLSCVNEQTVEQRSSRRVQRVDAVARLDGDRHVQVAVGERRGAHGGRSCVDDSRQDAPPIELHYGPAHERVRRQRVGAVRSLVDHQHAGARPGQQQRGRGPCAPRADDDHIESHGRLLYATRARGAPCA
jgi:hypothetical protein